MPSEIDLLLKGAHVVDPINGINNIRDIAISNGKIVEIEPSVSSAQALQVKYLDGYM